MHCLVTPTDSKKGWSTLTNTFKCIQYKTCAVLLAIHTHARVVNLTHWSDDCLKLLGHIFLWSWWQVQWQGRGCTRVHRTHKTSLQGITPVTRFTVLNCFPHAGLAATRTSEMDWGKERNEADRNSQGLNEHIDKEWQRDAERWKQEQRVNGAEATDCMDKMAGAQKEGNKELTVFARR